jgi:hypothetical protein
VRPLAPSPAWTLVTPTASAPDLGAGRTRRPRDFHLSHARLRPPFSPLRTRSRADPSGLGHAATFTRRPRDPPVSKRRQDMWLRKPDFNYTHHGRLSGRQRGMYSRDGSPRQRLDLPQRWRRTQKRFGSTALSENHHPRERVRVME